MSTTAERYPCYCLPGPARCDDDTACDRSAAVPDPADVEKAARAMAEAVNGVPTALIRRMAAAALAEMRPSPDSEAVARVEAVAAELEQDAEATLEQYAPTGPFDPQIVVQARGGAYAQQDAADRIRAALGTGDRQGADRG